MWLNTTAPTGKTWSAASEPSFLSPGGIIPAFSLNWRGIGCPKSPKLHSSCRFWSTAHFPTVPPEASCLLRPASHPEMRGIFCVHTMLTYSIHSSGTLRSSPAAALAVTIAEDYKAPALSPFIHGLSHCPILSPPASRPDIAHRPPDLLQTPACWPAHTPLGVF